MELAILMFCLNEAPTVETGRYERYEHVLRSARPQGIGHEYC
jgi:hypothetical protein